MACCPSSLMPLLAHARPDPLHVLLFLHRLLGCLLLLPASRPPPLCLSCSLSPPWDTPALAEPRFRGQKSGEHLNLVQQSAGCSRPEGLLESSSTRAILRPHGRPVAGVWLHSASLIRPHGTRPPCRLGFCPTLPPAPRCRPSPLPGPALLGRGPSAGSVLGVSCGSVGTSLLREFCFLDF